MAVIPVGFGQVNIKFEGNDAPSGAEVTFGIDCGVEVDPAVAAATVGGLWEAADIQGSLTGANVVSVLVKLGPNDLGPFAEVPYPIEATYGSGDSIANTAVLVHKQTLLGGRAGRGRMFLPGAPVGAADSAGILSETYVSNTTSALEAFRTTMEAATLGLVVLHSEDSPVSTPTPITFLSCDTKLATQRRRLRR